MSTKTSEHAALVHAIAVAFARSRTAPTEFLNQRRTGRVNRRASWRLRLNEQAVFQQRRLPGATKVNAHVLVDGSGSMSEPMLSLVERERLADPTTPPAERLLLRQRPTRIQQATALVEALTEALGKNAAVSLNVWLHHTATGTSAQGSGHDLTVKAIVRDGKGRENIRKMPSLIGSANGDGFILRWLGTVIRKHHRSDTVDIVIVISDGLPSWSAESGFQDPKALERDPSLPMHKNEEHVRDAVTNLRAQGVSVLSVSIIDNPRQAAMYGSGNIIPFSGDWNALAVDFGRAFGAVLRTASDKAVAKAGR